MNRVRTFCAGPSTLPVEMLAETRDALWEYGDSGISASVDVDWHTRTAIRVEAPTRAGRLERLADVTARSDDEHVCAPH